MVRHARTTFKDTSSNGLQLLTVNSSGGNIHFNGQLIQTGHTYSAFANKELDTLLSANGDVTLLRRNDCRVYCIQAPADR